ncbi:MAG: hypothetical protein EZS28_039172 [Streblomastix strix]|uniref:Uncharacterized protein n=1 Tax=Streblomastix strix TaxID=222440 RepID=A0A5J4U5R7_9EUKA|nr:MAG: hypothetical protein EZS28_039172 [Streblomastix strix]
MEPIKCNYDSQQFDLGSQNEQIIKIELPPKSVQFAEVQQTNSGMMALTIDGQLWLCYLKYYQFAENRTSGQWRENHHFITQNGLIQSSLGLSKIRPFSNGNYGSEIIILENGAVFIQDESYIDKFQFTDLTYSSKMKPKFIDQVCGQLSDEIGPFGVFGTFHVVKDCGGESFLTADWIIIQKVYQVYDRESYLYTPIDPKWFLGDRIALIHYIPLVQQDCWSSYRVYITQSGQVIILFNDDKLLYTDTIIEVLSNPSSVFQLPFPIDEMTPSIMGDWGYISVLKKD